MIKVPKSINKAGCVMLLVVLGFAGVARACIWDEKTLFEEKHEHPTLAQAILHPKTEKPDVKSLTEEIAKLKAAPNTNDPMWWNNLAGSYLRLGQPEEAVKILEPLTNHFANDYGIHANLGTAYHLLGRYVEAEREIRRDTEINTNAHFGLEKFHLALLQYLIRDKDYQMRHVYVDEFTMDFIEWGGAQSVNPLSIRDYQFAVEERNKANTEARKYLSAGNWTWTNNGVDHLMKLAAGDERPQYRAKWNLDEDPKLEDGLIYMASLNQKQPACWVMLGVFATENRDMKLAKTAWKRAIELGSPQAPLLQYHMNLTWAIKSSDWRENSFFESLAQDWVYWVPGSLLAVLAGIWIKRKLRRKRRQGSI